MDEIDVQIIQLLQVDGRMSISALADKISLSRPSVHERVQRLQESGVIEGYSANVSPQAVGRELLVMIELSSLRVPIAEFEDYVAEHAPEVIQCYKATGHVHYYMKAALNGMNELTRLIENLSPFGDTRTSILLEATIDKRVILPQTFNE